MNKSYKYTLLTLFLAVFFAFGSMKGMSLILGARERKFLSENGSATVEAPVRAWQEADSSVKEKNGGYAAQEGYVLTAKEMEKVIGRWDERMVVTLTHAPVHGQISMEEAMKAGEDWLANMGLIENGDGEAHSMYARLCAPMQNESDQEQLEPYYSFWFVRYFGQSGMAFLYINAVTGKVWNADVTLYEDLPKEIPYEKLSLFAELSGLQVSDTDMVVKDREGTQAVMLAEDSLLCAEMGFHRSQAGYLDLRSREEGLLEYMNEMPDKEKVGLTFKLTVSKEM